MVEAVSSINVSRTEQPKNGPTVSGALASTAVGAGIGYGYVSMAEAGAKKFLNTSEDSFVKACMEGRTPSVNKLPKFLELKEFSRLREIGSKVVDKFSVDAAKARFESCQNMTKEFLEKIPNAKIKYAAAGATLLLGAYLGIKTLMGKTKTQENA